MAHKVLLKHPTTGIMQKGFYGFSWTMFFFGGWPPIFRGDILQGLLVILLQWCTFGIGTFIYAFTYNKRYTLALLEKGYQFVDDEMTNARARAALGVSQTLAPVPATS